MRTKLRSRQLYLWWYWHVTTWHWQRHVSHQILDTWHFFCFIKKLKIKKKQKNHRLTC